MQNVIATIADAVIARAGELFRIDASLIRSRSRTVRVVRARFAVELAMRRAGWSLMEIGDELGRRDHTSVIYGVDKAEQTCKDEPDYAERVRELEQMLVPPAVASTS